MKIFKINIWVIVIIIFLLIPNIFAGDNEELIHVIDKGSTDYIPIDKDKMWQKIKDTATEYQQYAPIPRVAFFDITYPKDKDEYNELGGFGILLVTAVSQLETEFPIKNVYITTQNLKIELLKIGIIKSFIPKEPGVVISTVGKYREDSIYLFPMYLRAQSGQLPIDFSKNRSGFVLSEFPYEEDELPVKQPTKKAPSKEALMEIIEREIPIFGHIKI